jgi:DNA-binding cell septation regulator SpoVG
MTYNNSIHEAVAPEQSAAQGQSKNPMKIHILHIHQAVGGNLRAFVDIQLGQSVVIHGFRVIQQPGQKAWVSPPQREYVGADGKPRYASIVELSGELKRAVEQAILLAWEGGAA